MDLQIKVFRSPSKMDKVLCSPPKLDKPDFRETVLNVSSGFEYEKLVDAFKLIYGKYAVV